MHTKTLEMVLTIYVNNCWHCWHCNGTAELQPIARLRVSGDRTAGRPAVRLVEEAE